MKKILFSCGCSLLIISLAGCARLKQLTQIPSRIDARPGVKVLSLYFGPKTKIAVGDFEVNTAKATAEIGSGLREMLIAALIDSHRFSVAESQAAVNVGTQNSWIKSADLIISTTIAEFEPQASGGKAGMGGGGGAGSGAWGGLLGANLNKAQIALDIRIVNNSTSEVLAVSRVQGQASDAAGGFMAGLFGRGDLAESLSTYANTPMEKAINLCILEAVRYISQAIPANYYKY